MDYSTDGDFAFCWQPNFGHHPVASFPNWQSSTFGGAYAVLAYMGQDVVTQFGWLDAGEMMDGLGLAETTPGPLILVTEFVGFIAAFREGGMWVGLLGALGDVMGNLHSVFFCGYLQARPYIEWISAQPRLSSALTAITAAVVGVILNLSIWFGLHVFFAQVTREQYNVFTVWSPTLESFDWRVGRSWQLYADFYCCASIWGSGKVLAISAALGWVLVTYV